MIHVAILTCSGHRLILHTKLVVIRGVFSFEQHQISRYGVAIISVFAARLRRRPSYLWA